MMSSQEQSTNLSKKEIKIELTLVFDKSMTPNILTPLLCNTLADLGAASVQGFVRNVVNCDNEVNVVTIG